VSPRELNTSEKNNDNEKRIRCPYCEELIQKRAVVCRFCNRDFLFYTPLNDRLSKLEKVVERLVFESYRPHSSEIDSENAGELLQKDFFQVKLRENKPTTVSLPTFLLVLIIAGGCIASLVGMFAFFTFVLEIPKVKSWLFVLSLVCPMLFGIWSATILKPKWPLTLASGLFIAICSTLGMSGVIALVDAVPWFPQTPVEWREITLLVVCICASYISGIGIINSFVSAIEPRIHDGFTGKLAERIVKLLIAFYRQ
jgi:Na+/melibiose symporter-like transporter